ncbi:MAG: ABC transporter substrate-binding protein [Firmicutes bacterium]|nr:ABC transporter substrate-binding protein [Bacillota bacterium]
MRKNLTVFVGCMLALSLIATGCATGGKETKSGAPTQGAPAPQAPPQQEKVLVIAQSREGDNLDHIKTSWTTGIHFLVFDTLVTTDWDIKNKPGIAESWKVSDDGRIWTFKIRKGMKFHDGTPVDAKAVKWFFDAVLDPKYSSPSAVDYKYMKNNRVVDDYTFEVTLSESFPNFISPLTSSYAGIISAESYRKYGPDGTKEYGTAKVVGSGPFKFAEWVPNDRMVLVKNPDYTWGPDWVSNKGPVRVDKVVWRTIPDSSTQVAEMEAGNVHVLLEVPIESVDRLSKNPKVEVFKGPHFGLGYLAFATDKKPFTDVRVRRALNLALNREEIVHGVFRGLAFPAYGYLPPLMTEYVEDKNAHRYDVEEAKQLLSKAGYPNGFKATLATQNKAEHVRLAEVIKAQLAKIGVTTEIQVYDSAGYASFLKQGKQELFVREYSYSDANILQWFLESGQFPYPNHSRWRDKTTDRLIKEAESAPSLDNRTEKYKGLQRHLIDQAVWAPIWVPMKIQAVRSDKVKNWRMYPQTIYKVVLNDVDLVP